ncbi:hypothetical protein N7528_006692 [Penicillium herquei]|nr:hypothetical protein N7528_006692 [Penicillium herquei]
MSSLTYEDVEQLFDIHRVHQGIMQTWCEPDCVTTFPTAWRDVLLEMQLEVQNTIPINLLLYYARKMAQEILNPKAASESESDLHSNTDREIFRIKTENNFLFKGVICKGKSHNIFGQPDYVLCIERSLKCILVVVESKTLDHRPDRNDARYQLLCYMAMVHKARRDAGKPDCRVWGVATIGNQFHFLHITHRGDWAPFLVDLSPRMDSEGLNKILAILTAMIVDGVKQTNVNAPRPDYSIKRFSSSGHIVTPDDRALNYMQSNPMNSLEFFNHMYNRERKAQSDSNPSPKKQPLCMPNTRGKKSKIPTIITTLTA